jgi:hypothetical protein
MATTTHQEPTTMNRKRNIFTGKNYAVRHGFSGFAIIDLRTDKCVDVAVRSDQAVEMMNRYDRKRA